jgi:hypothetical protein
LEHDKFASHLYQSRKEYRRACGRSGKSGRGIERCLISTSRVAESLGFKGDLRQWQELLRIGELNLEIDIAQVRFDVEIPHARLIEEHAQDHLEQQ